MANDYTEYGGDLMIFLHTGATKQPIAYSTSAKLTIQMDTREKSSKDSGNYKSFAAGKLGWNMSTDALVNFTTTGTTLSVNELYGFMKARTTVNVAFGAKTGTSPSWTLNTGKNYFSGVALITNLDLNANDNDNATYSIQLQGTDELAIS